MSGRGFLIGKIIDDLDAIASQVRLRCAVNQYDLNLVLENFFKELLNLTYGINLSNLNAKRSNVPGLDLGDPAAKIAYQVTSRSDAAKIKETLRKITAAQHAEYDEIRILVIGERKKSYKIDSDLGEKFGFSEENIVGITDICRTIMQLEIATIQAIQRKLQDEQRGIRLELEPEIDGKFQTTALDQIEAAPRVRHSDASLLFAHEDIYGVETPEKAARELGAFARQLERLPRRARELFGWMIDHSELRTVVGGEGYFINADLVELKCGEEFAAELRLLKSWHFIQHESDHDGNSARFDIAFPEASSDFGNAIVAFLKDNRMSAFTVFSTMNFIAFGPALAVPDDAEEA